MSDAVDAIIECRDLDGALAFYTDELGFRIETIYPADAPRIAMLSADGVRLKLERPFVGEQATDPPALVISAPGDSGFKPGRAGMQYRDLIPGRFGGRYIASHIRIPAGGPVPDYVHHHDIEFQLIFCVSGWVQVAYEDQGEPMTLSVGDCFLQPPHIRHRVLECSDNMEVVEITCPAEHETAVDHQMKLPNARVDPDRRFGGQRFVFYERTAASWDSTTADGFEISDTGVCAATGGVVDARVMRAIGDGRQFDLSHDAEIRFLFVMNGTATLDAGGRFAMHPKSACAVPPNVHALLTAVSNDFEWLDLVAPRRRSDQ